MACSDTDTKGDKFVPRMKMSQLDHFIGSMEETGRDIQNSVTNLVDILSEVISLVEKTNDHRHNEQFESSTKIKELSQQLNDVTKRLQESPIPSPPPLAQSDEEKREMTRLQEVVQDLTLQVKQMKLLPTIQQAPTRISQYRVFAIHNPLQLMCDRKPWQSPVMVLGGTMGYRAGIRVFMAGEGFANGDSISIYFYLAPGPYDDWLKWPFPAKTIMLAMFRKGGKAPYVIPFEVNQEARAFAQPSREANFPGVGCPHFIDLPRFLSEDFVVKKSGPCGEDSVLMVGFAVEGEDTLCPKIETALETKVDRLERVVDKMEELPEDWVEKVKLLPTRDQSQRRPHPNYPFGNDVMYCC